ncbi:hypothetical protein D3C76_1242090 [compost metagenome]
MAPSPWRHKPVGCTGPPRFTGLSSAGTGASGWLHCCIAMPCRAWQPAQWRCCWPVPAPALFNGAWLLGWRPPSGCCSEAGATSIYASGRRNTRLPVQAHLRHRFIALAFTLPRAGAMSPCTAPTHGCKLLWRASASPARSWKRRPWQPASACVMMPNAWKPSARKPARPP